MARADVDTRKARPEDAVAILAAHRDSIRSIGPRFYPPEIVAAWSEGLTPDVYVQAMAGGEVFFIATGRVDGEATVLGFATHRVDDAVDGASVYVRSCVARQGIGSQLLAMAEQHAREGGTASLHVQASLAGVSFRALLGIMVEWLWAQGLRRLWLTTEPGTRAGRFYEKAGWRPAGSSSHGEIRCELSRAEA